MLEQNLPLFSNSHILISKEVMFGVKFLNTSYGFLFIALLEKVLYKFCLTVILLLFGLFLVVSTFIFIWKKPLNSVITSNLVNFYFPFQCLAGFLRLYLFACYLFCFWNVLLVCFSWSECHPLIWICYFILSYMISCLLRFILFQWGCDWCKWIFNFPGINCPSIHRL